MKYIILIVSLITLIQIGDVYTGTENFEISLEANDTTCDQHFNETTGIVFYQNKSTAVPPGLNCSWHIYGDSKDTDTIFLVFDELFLGEQDKIIITPNGQQFPYNPIEHLQDPGVKTYITDSSNVTVTLLTADTTLSSGRTFKMYFSRNSECNYTFANTPSGIIYSPLYAHANFTKPIECYFTVAVSNEEDQMVNLWFDQFIFYQAEVEIIGTQAQDAKFNASNPPETDFLAKENLVIKLSITNNSAVAETFIAYYDSVNKNCSFYQKVNPTDVISLKSPSADVLQYLLSKPQQHTLSCLWLLESTKGSILSVNVKNSTLPESMDQVFILDGLNGSCPALLELNKAEKQKDRVTYSSGNKLEVTASSLFITKGFSVEIEVTQAKDGGHYHDQGSFVSSVSNSATYLLEVQPGLQVKLLLGNKTLVTSGGMIQFYSDFKEDSMPFATLKPDQTLYPVVSPTEKMAVVTNNFTKSKLDASFLGVEKGCYELATGPGDTYTVSGNCNKTCVWTVPSQNFEATDVLSFHFPLLNMTTGDELVIRKFDAAQHLVVNQSLPAETFPDVWLPAKDGVLLQVTRSNCNLNNTVLKASYLVIKECLSVFQPGLGETVHITSPNYPNHYPLGASCNWTVKLPPNATFLLLTLRNLQLAAVDHVLKVFSQIGNTTTLVYWYNSTNSDILPDDAAVFGDVVIQFTTNFTTPLQNLPGFELDVTVIEKGEVLYNATGTLASPDIPQPLNRSSVFAWIVQIPSNATRMSIVDFHFIHDNSTDINDTLKIYDGGSLRSRLLNNFTGPEILSRTKSVIFFYQRSGSTLASNFSIAYSSFACNMTNLCRTGICMHDDWHCNGVNDCDDWSDERTCSNAPPVPPTPAPSGGNNGVSSGVLAASIVASLVVGAILAVLIPFAYRRFRDRRMQTYTSLNS